MARVAEGKLLQLHEDCSLVLADIDPGKAAEVADALGHPGVEDGRVDISEAVELLMALDAGENVRAVKPYIAILGAVISQFDGRELGPGGLRRFLRDIDAEPLGESVGGILVAVEGTKEDRRIRMQAAESDRQGGSEGGMDMDEAMGTPHRFRLPVAGREYWRKRGVGHLGLCGPR
ncbi:MAG: hypothetical protein SWK76_14700 [Actinomycetota bacterium]|nr:hypothetical protein [Actinomycetota bacterium]